MMTRITSSIILVHTLFRSCLEFYLKNVRKRKDSNFRSVSWLWMFRSVLCLSSSDCKLTNTGRGALLQFGSVYFHIGMNDLISMSHLLNMDVRLMHSFCLSVYWACEHATFSTFIWSALNFLRMYYQAYGHQAFVSPGLSFSFHELWVRTDL